MTKLNFQSHDPSEIITMLISCSWCIYYYNS